MSQTKAQLVTPVGVVTASSMTVTGVLTATTFDGNVIGAAVSIAQGSNLNVGVITASGIGGDITGSATSITQGTNVTFGSLTATFVGDFTGTASSIMPGSNVTAGIVTASSFSGPVTGNVTGNLTGNVVGTAGSILSGNNVRAGIATVAGMSGDGSALTGIAATSFNTQTVPDNKTFSINVTSPAGGNYTLSGTDRSGTVSGSSDPAVTVEIGDTLNFVVDASGHPFYIRVSDGGANVSTPAATNQGSQSGTVSWTPNTAGTYYYQCGNHASMLGTITVTATTTIDLSAGNCITFNQSANTTVAFANTSTAMDVTLIRVKDSTTTARTITWPDSVKWNGGTAPTLISNTISGDSQQFQFLTRDSGLTWYAWEPYKRDALASELFTWGENVEGKLGDNSTVHRSSPVQIAGTTWSHAGNTFGFGDMAWGTKTDGTLWTWGDGAYGTTGHNSTVKRSSPTQVGTDTTWSDMVNIGEGFSVASAAVKTDGTLWTWGHNFRGMLGQNQAEAQLDAVSSPVQVPGTTWGTDVDTLGGGDNRLMAIKTDGTLWYWGYGGYGSMGNNVGGTAYNSSPVQIGGTTWKNIAVSRYVTFATKTDNTLWAWGTGGYGSFCQNNTTSRSSPIQIPGSWATGEGKVSHGQSALLAIKTDGTLWAAGWNQQGVLGQNQQGVPNSYSSPVQIGTSTDWGRIGSGSYAHYAIQQT